MGVVEYIMAMSRFLYHIFFSQNFVLVVLDVTGRKFFTYLLATVVFRNSVYSIANTR